jgi:hypothetical protein
MQPVASLHYTFHNVCFKFLLSFESIRERKNKGRKASIAQAAQSSNTSRGRFGCAPDAAPPSSSSSLALSSKSDEGMIGLSGSRPGCLNSTSLWLLLLMLRRC